MTNNPLPAVPPPIPGAAAPVQALPIALQHHVLWHLLFSQKYATEIRSMLDIGVWIGRPEMLAFIQTVYDYIDHYKGPPGPAVESLILGMTVSEEHKESLRQIVSVCQGYYSTDIDGNHQYILDCVKKFHKQSVLKQTIHQIIPLIDRTDKFDEVESILMKGIQQKMESFDAGATLMGSFERHFHKTPEQQDHTYLRTGIHLFDKMGAMPRRKAMTLFIAVRKYGKSWFFVHMGKRALIEGKRVAHVTLENSQEQTEDRYLQCIGAMAANNFGASKSRLTMNEDQFTTTLDSNLRNLDNIANVSDLYRRVSGSDYLMNNLRIKEFPTKKLTVKQLETWLDGLNVHHGFVPDVLIIDYPDLMKVGKRNDHRIEIGDLYADLRGVAVERNLILLVASQVQRGSEQLHRIEERHIAEDINKAGIADITYSYHRTKFEASKGLGRVYIVNSRYSRMDVEALICQNYAIGQFLTDSREYSPDWQQKLKDLQKLEEGK